MHMMFLCFSGFLYSCGLNTYHPLGLLPVLEKCLAPKLVCIDTLNFNALSLCLSVHVSVSVHGLVQTTEWIDFSDFYYIYHFCSYITSEDAQSD